VIGSSDLMELCGFDRKSLNNAIHLGFIHRERRYHTGRAYQYDLPGALAVYVFTSLANRGVRWVLAGEAHSKCSEILRENVDVSAIIILRLEGGEVRVVASSGRYDFGDGTADGLAIECVHIVRIEHKRREIIERMAGASSH